MLLVVFRLILNHFLVTHGASQIACIGQFQGNIDGEKSIPPGKISITRDISASEILPNPVPAFTPHIDNHNTVYRDQERFAPVVDQYNAAARVPEQPKSIF